MAEALETQVGPGATAVLHGMLATLSEALEGLDRRLAGLEGDVGAMRAALQALTAVDDEEEAPEDAVTPAMLDAVAVRLDERLAGLTAAVAQRASTADVAEVASGLGAEVRGVVEPLVRQAVDEIVVRVFEALPAPPEIDVDFDVEGVARRTAEATASLLDVFAGEQRRLLGDVLGEAAEGIGASVRGTVAEVSGQAASVAAAVGGLEGRLHELVDGVRVVTQHAHALAALPARIESLREDIERLRREVGTEAVLRTP